MPVKVLLLPVSEIASVLVTQPNYIPPPKWFLFQIGLLNLLLSPVPFSFFFLVHWIVGP